MESHATKEGTKEQAKPSRGPETLENASFGETFAKVMASVPQCEARSVPLRRALFSYLAENVVASENLNPFTGAAIDGYAVRFDDVKAASADNPVRLGVIETVSAGTPSSKRVSEATCARVMTGAIIPDGSDTVIKWNDARLDGDVLEVRRPPDAQGQNVRQEGDDVRRGDPALKAGALLGPAQIGLLAALGRAEVLAHRQPVLATLSIGDEIVANDSETVPRGYVRNISGPLLGSLLAELHLSSLDLGVERDNVDRIKARIEKAMYQVDGVILTGGTNMGEQDVTEKVLREFAPLVVRKTRISPGSPFTMGRYRGKPIFALPGNPSSTYVTFHLFVRPALAKMCGGRDPKIEFVQGTLANPIADRLGIDSFLRGAYRITEEGKIVVSTFAKQASGIYTSSADANCLVRIPAHVDALAAGDAVRILPLSFAALTWREP
jgi:molybdopterin molybdotransferase